MYFIESANESIENSALQHVYHTPSERKAVKPRIGAHPDGGGPPLYLLISAKILYQNKVPGTVGL